MHLCFQTVPLPAGSTSVLAKPTKYHYYPHNQHIYLLPECAIQQVFNIGISINILGTIIANYIRNEQVVLQMKQYGSTKALSVLLIDNRKYILYVFNGYEF